MTTQPIRIILVDDHKLARDAWATLLGYDERFTVIAICGDGQEAIELASQLQPDIMIVDVNMSPINGFEITQKVLAENPAVKIIGISINNHPSYASRMLAVGARGFISKGTSFEEIAKAIVNIHGGGEYRCPDTRFE